MLLQEMNHASAASEAQRANEVFRRYKERRQLARQMLKQSPDEPSSPPSPSGRIVGSCVWDEVDYYFSDFTEEEEEDGKWIADARQHMVTAETSSGGEEVFTSSEDEELQLLMVRSEKHLRRQPPSTDFRKQCRRNASRRTKNMSSSATDNAVKDNLPDTDGRRFNLPHDRPLDPWRLPPIENLTKKGPVTLVLNPATSQDAAHEGPSTASIPDQLLVKSLRAKTRKLKKFERQKKKRKQLSRNK